MRAFFFGAANYCRCLICSSFIFLSVAPLLFGIIFCPIYVIHLALFMGRNSEDHSLRRIQCFYDLNLIIFFSNVETLLRWHLCWIF